MPFETEKQRRWMWMNKPKMARKWTDEHGSTPVKAGLGTLVRDFFRKRGNARASSSSSQVTGDPRDKLLDYFKTKYSRTARPVNGPIHAKKGKYQEFTHPQHDILPLEHMEENMSAKERVERLLDERKKKKESKKQLVKAVEGELVRQKTQGTGAAVKGIQHYTMKGMPTAQTGQLVQVPTEGTGAAVKGTDHYVMGQRLYEQAYGEHFTTGLFGRKKMPDTGGAPPPLRLLSSMVDYWRGKPDSLKRLREFNKKYPPPKDSKYQLKAGGPIKAKKGIWAGAATDMYDKPPGWDVKKISDKTHKKLTELWKHREKGGWSPAAGKEYRAHLKGLKKLTTKVTLPLAVKKSKSYYFKDAPSSEFLKRKLTLAGGANTTKTLLAVLKKVGKRTAIGKGIVAATVVAGAYEAGKRNLFKLKDKKRVDKKKVDKKFIGGETVVMKSGGGYIDELL